MKVDEIPEPVERLLRYAGKTRRQVHNPNLTANQAIIVAEWIVKNCNVKVEVKEYERTHG